MVSGCNGPDWRLRGEIDRQGDSYAGIAGECKGGRGIKHREVQRRDTYGSRAEDGDTWMQPRLWGKGLQAEELVGKANLPLEKDREGTEVSGSEVPDVAKGILARQTERMTSQDWYKGLEKVLTGGTGGEKDE